MFNLKRKRITVRDYLNYIHSNNLSYEVLAQDFGFKDITGLYSYLVRPYNIGENKDFIFLSRKFWGVEKIIKIPKCKQFKHYLPSPQEGYKHSLIVVSDVMGYSVDEVLSMELPDFIEMCSIVFPIYITVQNTSDDITIIYDQMELLGDYDFINKAMYELNNLGMTIGDYKDLDIDRVILIWLNQAKHISELTNKVRQNILDDLERKKREEEQSHIKEILSSPLFQRKSDDNERKTES